MSVLFTKDGARGLKTGQKPPSGLFLMLGISLLFTIVSIYGAQASVFEKARGSVLDRLAPVLSIFNAPVRFVGERVGKVGDYFAVLDENAKLREENEELRIWMHQAMALEQRLAEYQNILGARTVETEAFIPAQVIAENSGPFSRALVVSAGAEDGIREGSAVVDGDGLIGHVVTVGAHASRVLLLTDANSHVPVYIEAVDTEGLLSGTAERRAEIRQFSGRPKGNLEVGMRIVTSGTGGALPRGLPVGEVVRLTEEGVEVGLYASDQGAYLVRVLDYQFPSIDTPAYTNDSPGTDEPAQRVARAVEGADG